MKYNTKALTRLAFLACFAMGINGCTSSSGDGAGTSTNTEQFFFGATNGSDDTELWISDGTEAATSLLRDIYPGPERSIYPNK